MTSSLIFKMKKRNWIINTFELIMSFLATISLTMVYYVPKDYIEENATSLLGIVHSGGNGGTIIQTILFCAILAFSHKMLYKDGIKPSYAIISVIIGGVYLMAENYRIDNTLSHISYPNSQIAKSVIYLLGISFIILLILCFFEKTMYTNLEKEQNEIKTKDFLKIFLTLMLFWIYPLILSYPANMNWDAWYQLQQFWRFSPFNTHQPIMHTLIMGMFTLIGYLFGSSDVGLFLFVAFQTIVYGLVISYSFVLLNKMKSPRWLKCIYFISCIFSPYYVNSANSVIKDSLYSISFLLFIIEMIYAISDIEEFVDKKIHWLLSMIAIFGVITLRSNGKFIYLPVSILLICFICKNCKRSGSHIFNKLAIILFLPVGLMVLFNVGFEAAVSEVQKVSIVESLSLPFQQTARTMLYHGDELSQEEYNSINRVLDVDELAGTYDPRISDPIKLLFREDSTKEEIIDYLLTWVKIGARHPFTYLETIVNQNYGLVYLKDANDTVFMDYLADGDLASKFENSIGLFEYRRFDDQQDALEEWYMLMFSTPIIGLISHPALYILLLFVVLLIALKNKMTDCLLILLPLLLTIMFIIIGPVFHGHPRYAFPIIYSMPIVYSYTKYRVNSLTNLNES